MDKDKRIGFIGIMIYDLKKAPEVNEIIHKSKDLIIGRMGIPNRERNVGTISLIVEGTNDEVSALTGNLGRISGVTVKSMLEKKNI